MGAQGSSLQISGLNDDDLITAVCQEYAKDPAQAERIIREVERLNQPLAKILQGEMKDVSFQVSYGITASTTPIALESKRVVVSRRAGDNYATVVQYDDHDTMERGMKYSKKRARLSLERYEELYSHVHGRVWNLPKLSHEGMDLYGMDVGLFVRVGDNTWANAPDGCHADADEDDEVAQMTGEHKLEFGGCVSVIEQCVSSLDEADWIYQGVVKGNSCPVGGLSAFGGAGQFGGGDGKPEQEEFILESGGGNTVAGAGQTASNSASSAGTGGVEDDATKQQWREKAGDVPMDENFLDDDWD